MNILQRKIIAKRIEKLEKAKAMHLAIAKDLGLEEWVQGEVRYHENQSLTLKYEISRLKEDLLT